MQAQDPPDAPPHVVTNVEVLQRLAVDCLGNLPVDEAGLRLTAPDMAPYLRSALVAYWQETGVPIYAPNADRPAPALTYAIESIDVAYGRAGRDRYRRTVDLGLRYTATDADDRILHDARCTPTFTDVVAKGDVDQLEDPAYAETQGDRPLSRWRRWIQPIVLTAAVGVVTFLFFSVRNDGRSDAA